MRSEDGAALKRSGLPAGRYLLAVPLSVVAFILVALVDQPQTLLSLLPTKSPAPRAIAGPTPGSEAAVDAVRKFDAALESCYAMGSAEPLGALAVSGELREQIVADVMYQAKCDLPPKALAEFQVLQVEPAGAGWEVTTFESWAPENGNASRLRFRYRLAPAGGALEVASMDPILPEPVRETAP